MRHNSFYNLKPWKDFRNIVENLSSFENHLINIYFKLSERRSIECITFHLGVKSYILKCNCHFYITGGYQMKEQVVSFWTRIPIWTVILNSISAFIKIVPISGTFVWFWKKFLLWIVKNFLVKHLHKKLLKKRSLKKKLLNPTPAPV